MHNKTMTIEVVQCNKENLDLTPIQKVEDIFPEEGNSNDNGVPPEIQDDPKRKAMIEKLLMYKKSSLAKYITEIVYDEDSLKECGMEELEKIHLEVQKRIGDRNNLNFMKMLYFETAETIEDLDFLECRGFSEALRKSPEIHETLEELYIEYKARLFVNTSPEVRLCMATVKTFWAIRTINKLDKPVESTSSDL